MKLFRTKNGIKVFIGVLCLIALNACTAQVKDKKDDYNKNSYDKNAYNRANRASEKALDKLDRE